MCSVSDMYPGYTESWNICGMEWNIPRFGITNDHVIRTEYPKNSSVASRSNNNYM